MPGQSSSESSALPAYIGGLVRWAASLAGGALATHGVTEGDQTTLIAGVFLGVASVAWNMWQKRKSAEHIEEARALPLANGAPTPNVPV